MVQNLKSHRYFLISLLKVVAGEFILIIMVRKDILHVVLVHNIEHEWDWEQLV